MNTPPEIHNLRPFTPTNIAYNTSIHPFEHISIRHHSPQEESYKYNCNNVFIDNSSTKDSLSKQLSTYLNVISHKSQKNTIPSKPLINNNGLILCNNNNSNNKKHKPKREIYSARFNSNNIQHGLKYLPKRKIRNINLNLSTSPKNENKVTTCSNNNYLYNTQRTSNTKSNSNINVLSNEIPQINIDTLLKKDSNNKVHNESEFLQFRTSSILEYSKNSEYLSKIEKYFDLISDEHKNISVGLYSKLLKIYEENNKIIFNKPNLSQTITFPTWKNMVSLFSDFSYTTIHLFSILFTEIKTSKDKILSLSKKTLEQSNALTQQANDFNEVNKYIRKHELTNFTKKKKTQSYKEKEFQLKKTQITFSKKENAYIMTIHRLEEEINDLIKVLNENKTSSDKVKRAQKRMEETNKQMDVMQMNFNKKINGVNIRMGIFKDEIEVLNEQISKLEEKNLELMAIKDEQAKIIIDRTAEKKNLKNQIDEIMEENTKLKEVIEKYEIKEKEGCDNQRAFIERIATLKLNDDDESENDVL